ncbi:MAG: sugar isomerase domain-containing protein [Bdellovibrionales bacterium]|nr:sugar isomerase domain-containing protein [Bdellovibrionales bacterium]
MQKSYSSEVLAHLSLQANKNKEVIAAITKKLVEAVVQDRFLFVSGSGHSAIFAMELYHRAGGPSFVIPVVDEKTLPVFGPAKARAAERTPDALLGALKRVGPKPGEMLWINSQSGINPAIVELALEAKRMGLETVAFTSVAHSSSGKSRHVSGKRLFEVCDHVVDLGGVSGDALVPVEGAPRSVSVGPFSTLSAVFLAHMILGDASAQLERSGIACVYTSVNTPEGEARNREIEEKASLRDPRLTAL